MAEPDTLGSKPKKLTVNLAAGDEFVIGPVAQTCAVEYIIDTMGSRPEARVREALRRQEREIDLLRSELHQARGEPLSDDEIGRIADRLFAMLVAAKRIV